MADPSQNRGCLGFLFPEAASSEPPKAKRDPADLEGAWPYRRKPLLSPAEFSFFRVLEKAVGDGHVVHVKVRLGDLLTGWKGQPGEKTWWNKIAQKHADFVVCPARLWTWWPWSSWTTPATVARGPVPPMR